MLGVPLHSARAESEGDAVIIRDAAVTHCGSSVADALKVARAALAKNDTAQDHAALACLLSATATLDAREAALEQGKQSSGVLKMPQHPDRNQKSGP